MVSVAIVEDDTEYAKELESYLRRYEEENGSSFKITQFPNAVAMLENYTAAYDIIFMDIRMPYMNGMDAAHKLRELDKNVILIFVTSLRQYAVQGYEVDALDYVVKPISYYEFALKLSRAIQRLPMGEKNELVVSTVDGIVKLMPEDIRYLESVGHHVLYHGRDKEYRQYGSLSSAEKKWKTYGFARCNSCYLVNLRYVEDVKGYTATVGGIKLQISQPRKKAFVSELVRFAERGTT